MTSVAHFVFPFSSFNLIWNVIDGYKCDIMCSGNSHFSLNRRDMSLEEVYVNMPITAITASAISNCICILNIEQSLLQSYLHFVA